ncbi:hypothetical protein [Streptomyces sp. CAU 1734]|uniref:hypothetical protein n=1 Tax=Streptomyces sp. CAU 1734 TaxID=3140360 RepID=UPI003260D5C6
MDDTALPVDSEGTLARFLRVADEFSMMLDLLYRHGDREADADQLIPARVFPPPCLHWRALA